MTDHSASHCPLHIATFALKLRALRDSLTEGLVERDVAVRLALLAALAGEHLLLLGPPGTAKSLIARRLHLAFHSAAYFERLLTRFTVPEEIFGPLSIKGLEEDRYERLTKSYLPTASIAFLDEIFKANSAILNALLTLLNEREFDNGAVRDKTPLVAVIGASNELPEGEELDALYDRFLLRLHVGAVTKAAFPALLGLRGQATPRIQDHLKLHAHELSTIQEVAEAVEVPEDVVALLCDLREWCTAEGVMVSDRRWRKVVKLLQVAAATNGRSAVSIWDCWLLQHCLWDTPEVREKVFAWYSDRVGASAAMDPSRFRKIVAAWEAKLKVDQEDRSQMCDSEGFLLYIGEDGELTRTSREQVHASRDLEKLFLAPAGASPHALALLGSGSADRTNGGCGYTVAELDRLFLPDQSETFGTIPFSRWVFRGSYLGDYRNWHLVEVDLPPAEEPGRRTQTYIDGCIREISSLKADVANYHHRLSEHLSSLTGEIGEHLWITPEFAAKARWTLEESMRQVKRLSSRINRLYSEFGNLPREVTSEYGKFLAQWTSPTAVSKEKGFGGW